MEKRQSGERKIISIRVNNDPCEGGFTGKLLIHIIYDGKAPDSVANLRNKSRRLGYYTKTYPRGAEIRKDNWSIRTRRVNYIAILADELEPIALEIGGVMLEFIEGNRRARIEANKEVSLDEQSISDAERITETP